MSTYDDPDYFQRILKSDDPQDREAFKQCEQLIIIHAGFILRDFHKAEDLVSKVLLRASDSYNSTLAIHKSPKNWIIMLARQAAIQEIRRRPGKYEIVEDSPDNQRKYSNQAGIDNIPLSEFMEHNELRQQVVDAIMQLAQDQRSVVVMRFYHQYTWSQIADVLQMHESKVRRKWEKAAEQLRELLGDFRFN